MDIADKIRKLEALANDRAATEGERDTARRMAQKLRARYGANTNHSRSSFDPNKRRESYARGFEETWQRYQQEDRAHEESFRRAWEHTKNEWFRGRYQKREKIKWKWHYYEDAKAEAGFAGSVNGKIKVDFTKAQSSATVKQMNYVYIICERFEIDPPDETLTFDCASDFLKHWDPIYQRGG